MNSEKLWIIVRIFPGETELFRKSMLYFLFFVDQYMADFGEPEVENLLDL